MQVAHSTKQECYLRYKHDLLKEYSTTGGIRYSKTYNDRYKLGYTEEYRFKTKCDPIFNTYRELFYPDGKKIVPDSISELDELGLAIWFMDDGYRTGRNLKGAVFATHSFSEEDKQKLLNLLQNKFGLKCSIQKEGTIYI